MEGVVCAAAVRSWIGQGINDLHLLDHGAWPAMCHDHRQRVRMRGADVNEMNVEAVDLGDELRQGVEARFDLAPVVIGLPVTDEVLQHRQRHTL
jgi:hypothetical protein